MIKAEIPITPGTLKIREPNPPFKVGDLVRHLSKSYDCLGLVTFVAGHQLYIQVDWLTEEGSRLSEFANVYLFGMVVGFHEDFIHDDSPCRPFKVEWLHKEEGWTYYGDFWYDDELELVE